MAASSWASSPAVRASMLGNRSRDTKPELALRRLVYADGLRYRVCARPIPRLNRTADLVFTRVKVAVFVDGCYWHGCPQHGREPATNSAYWAEKIARNKARDRETTLVLQVNGWTVLRFWEHENSASCAAQVAAAVNERRRA